MSLLQTHLASVKPDAADTKAETSHVAGTCSLSSDKYCSNSWVIDSGASSHICHNLSLFVNIRCAAGTSVILPNKNRFVVKFLGEIKLGNELLLSNVLYVPKFSYNLLSDSSLLKDDRYAINFSGNSCFI